MDLDLEFQKEIPERREVFNFKDSESQEKFKISTSDTKAFTNCFSGDLPLLQKVENWRKVLKSFCQKSFRRKE